MGAMEATGEQERIMAVRRYLQDGVTQDVPVEEKGPQEAAGPETEAEIPKAPGCVGRSPVPNDIQALIVEPWIYAAAAVWWLSGCSKQMQFEVLDAYIQETQHGWDNGQQTSAGHPLHERDGERGDALPGGSGGDDGIDLACCLADEFPCADQCVS